MPNPCPIPSAEPDADAGPGADADADAHAESEAIAEQSAQAVTPSLSPACTSPAGGYGLSASALDAVVRLTGLRDRTEIDNTLLGSVAALPTVRRVQLWRLIGALNRDLQHKKWRLCAELGAGETVILDAVAVHTLTQVPSLQMPWHTDSLVHLAEVSVPLVPEEPPSCGGNTGLVASTLLPMPSELDNGGVLEIQAEQPLDDATLHTIRHLVVIHRHVLNLLDYCERDTLTRLLNRKSFDNTFMHATVSEAMRLYGTEESDDAGQRQAGPLRYWLGVIDIDHFKLINDKYGHLVGDEALTVVADIMRSTFRHDDQLYRFGGEEFVVLLGTKDEVGAMVAFTRFRKAIEGHLIKGIGHVTVSIGFSDVRAGDTPQACFDRADQAVYYGKTHGRNQVNSYSELVTQGIFQDHSHFGAIELF